MKYVVLCVLAGCGGSPATIDAPPGAGDAKGIDAAPMHVDDGTPTRQTCTNSLGNALGASFGRIDGFLVAVVGTNGVDDVHTATRELVMPGGAWSEGIHPSIPTDYPSLGVHSTDLALQTHQQMTSILTSDLATANHISVYATPYGPDGAHLVHRNSGGRDGMIVTEPLSTPSHARLLSFSSQTF